LHASTEHKLIQLADMAMYYQKKRAPSTAGIFSTQLGDENIPPDEFICIAEQYGLICKIGEWVLNRACLVAKGWDPQRKISVCVNVSVIQLQDDNFQDIVDKALSTSLLSPELLHLEITESVLANNQTI